MAFAATLLAGRYQLDEPIGAGGYGQVWRATDTVLSRPVAVKLLHAGYAQQAETLGRFKAEAQQAGSLSHPNIARVYDYGESADGQPPYLLMELIDGPSLANVLADGPRRRLPCTVTGSTTAAPTRATKAVTLRPGTRLPVRP